MKSIQYLLKPGIAAAFLTCLACASGGGGYTVVQPGPPPYAPGYAYRYRHPNDRVLLVYDPAIHAYTVTGYPNYYYSSGRYYRVRGNTWYRTSRLDGPWRAVSYKSVPSGLHQKYKPKQKPAKYKESAKHSRKHGRGQSKHDD